MSVGKEPKTGENDDRVRIRIRDEDLQIVEHYAFHSSVFQQPAAFAVTLSGGRGVGPLRRRYTPGMTCRIYTGNNAQCSGEIDAVNATGDAQRTTVQITGRDMLARIHDQNVEGEFSIDNASYEDLVRMALADVDQPTVLISNSNDANRTVRAGAGVKITKAAVKDSEPKKFNTIVTSKMGETWLQFLERHLKKVGLFIWSDAYGNIVLSRPNPNQLAAFHFYRTTKNEHRVANVKSWSLTDDTTGRFTNAIVFARNHGKKAGHNHTHGDFYDEEMAGLIPYERRRVFRDVNVNTEEEAAFYARRRIAEVNRAGWKLQYTIAGHSALTMNGMISGSGERAIVCPDMIASVDDDELEIHDDLYITSVEHRAPPRETVITMMRTQDLLFDEDQVTKATAKAAAEVKERKEQLDVPFKDLEGLRLGSLPKGLDFRNLGFKDPKH